MKNILIPILIYSIYLTGFCGAQGADDCGCSISIGAIRTLKHAPIYVYTKTNKIIYADNGTISVKTGDTMEAHCTRPGMLIDFQKYWNLTSLSLKCLYRRKFLSNGRVVDLAFLECIKPVVSTTQMTSLPCGYSRRDTNKLIYVGFMIEGDRFIWQYSVCFDLYRHTTQFIYSMILPLRTNRILGIRWRDPRDDYFYLAKEIHKYYTNTNQRTRINYLMNAEENSTAYINEWRNMTLRKTFIVSMEDYLYLYEKEALRYYFNIVPLWDHINRYSWRGINKFAHKYALWNNVSLTSYAGTLGIMCMQQLDTKIAVPIYLATSVNTKCLPVPGYLWRLLYDKENSAGVVLVAVNVRANKTFTKLCNDVSTFIPFLQNYMTEYVYACSISDWSTIVTDVFPYFYVDKLLGTEMRVSRKDNSTDYTNSSTPFMKKIYSKIKKILKINN